ncbi:hypothetical protein FIE12Z_164 [Fusarium flagelliforme]|uniref:Uncharacterized protein n=1 Tax=Fusarium flagelliforme TaxID=2675880 RepID=A0A395N5W0_9HYPO|nr:hypothetical protein FIE12Z_164 [Fusarium flagelliforme]
MGLIGLAISSIFGCQDNGNRTGGCSSRRNPNQQAWLASSYPEITNYNGRSSCHQRKMERRYQRQLQRAERFQLRAEQRAQRRQAGVMLVKQGAQRVGLVGQPQVENVPATRNFREESKDAMYELDAINEQRDAPPSYDEVVRK